MTWVKVCGLARPDDVEWAVRCGADAVGFVLEPTSPRRAPESDLGALLAPAGGVHRVAVFGPMGELPTAGFTAIQALAETLPPYATCARIGVVRPDPGDDVGSVAMRCLGFDFVLFDSFHAEMLGGTGETADWGFAAELRAAIAVPMILAGGLSGDNVAAAIAQVRPFGVDASSRLESAPGVKDALLVRAYIEAAKGA